MNRWKVVSVLLFGVVLGLAASHLPLEGRARADDPTPATPVASAPTTGVKCVWTYISDSFSPDIGESGVVKLDEQWQRMSDGGWQLKAIGGSQGDAYVFERCR